MAHQAALAGDILVLEEWLSRHNDCNITDEHLQDRTLLHCAAYSGSVECVQALLRSKSIDVNRKDRLGLSPLQCAGFKNHLEVVKLLIEANADVNQVDNDYSSALHKACQEGFREVVIALLEAKDCSPNLGDASDLTPLHIATERGHAAIVQILIRHGADPNRQDVDGQAPLHVATYHLHPKTVRYLLKKTAKPELADIEGATPLHLAAWVGSRELVEMLMEAMEDVNLKDVDGCTPLSLSAEQGNLDCVNALLTHPRVSLTPDGLGETPIHKAALCNRVEVLEVLLKYAWKPDEMGQVWGVDTMDSREATALLGAAFNGHLRCVALLLEHGADVNHHDEEGATALHKSAFNGHLDVLELLLVRQSDIDKADASGATPLHKAAFNGQTSAILMLCKVGAQVTAVDYQGGTALHNAAYGGHTEAVNSLLRFLPNAATIAAADREGFNALHMAASQGHDAVVNQLLMHRDSPFHIDAETHGGWTALSLALKQLHGSTALLLVHRGAKFNLDKEMTRRLRSVPQSLLQEIKYEHTAYLNSKSGSSPARKFSIALSGNTPISSSAGASMVTVSGIHTSTTAPVGLSKGRRKTDQVTHTVDESSSSSAAVLSSSNTNSLNMSSDSLGGDGSAGSSTNKINGNLSGSSAPGTPTKRREKKRRSSSRPEKKLLREESPPVTPYMESPGTPTLVPTRNKARRVSSSADASRRRAESVAQQPIPHTKEAYTKEAYTKVGLEVGLNDLTPTNVKYGRNPTGSLYVSHRAARPRAEDVLNASPPTTNDSLQKNPKSLTTTSLDSVPAPGGATTAPLSSSMNSLNQSTPSAGSYEMSRRAPRKFKRQTDSPETTQAVEMFKRNPGDAIELLIEAEVLEDNCTAVARWIFERDDLDKAQMGLFLSREKNWNSAILDAFVELFDFSDMEFDMALRRYLSKFRLPGEAQKIDRLMEKFACRYLQQNPGQDIFADKDAVYVLAFSIIMLNTDAHNPAIKKANKMTRVQFIRNTAGINGGNDFPEKFLSELYEKIVMYEIKMESDETEFTNAKLKGWLMKQGGKVKSWKKRWFVLDGNCLFYFGSSSDRDPTGIIPLENLLVQQVISKRRHTFELRTPNEGPIKATVRKNSQMVVGSHEAYLFQAANGQEMHLWMDSLNRNIFRNPFYLLLAAKKKQMETRLKGSSTKSKSKTASLVQQQQQPQPPPPTATATAPLTTITTTTQKPQAPTIVFVTPVAVTAAEIPVPTAGSNSNNGQYVAGTSPTSPSPTLGSLKMGPGASGKFKQSSSSSSARKGMTASPAASEGEIEISV